MDLHPNMDEKVFKMIFKNGGRIKDSADEDLDRTVTVVNGSCSIIVHYQSHKMLCRELLAFLDNPSRLMCRMRSFTAHSHIIDGVIKPSGQIIPYEVPCQSTLLIFQPVNLDLAHIAIIIPKHPHNHARRRNAKASLKEKKLLKEIYDAAGKCRVTPKGLQSSTQVLPVLTSRS